MNELTEINYETVRSLPMNERHRVIQIHHDWLERQRKTDLKLRDRVSNMIYHKHRKVHYLNCKLVISYEDYYIYIKTTFDEDGLLDDKFYLLDK